MKEKTIFYRASDHHFLDSDIKILERGFYKKPGDWFSSKEAATEHFVTARKIAVIRAETIQKELKALEQNLGFSIHTPTTATPMEFMMNINILT
jgi:hypothetical protein